MGASTIHGMMLKLTGGALDLDYTMVVAPLTTGLKIESPDDVIGFCARDVVEDSVDVVTLAGRDWTASAQYTGLTEELYTRNLADPGSLVTLIRRRPRLVAFANGMVARALEALGVAHAPIIPVTKAAQFFRTGALPLKQALVDMEETGEAWPAAKALGLLMDIRVPRMMSRVQWCGELWDWAWADAPSELPVMERNLGIDAAIWGKVRHGDMPTQY